MISERVGIYDPNTDQIDFIDVPYHILRIWCQNKKPEPVEIHGKTYLAIKISGNKLLLRPIS